MIEDDGIGFMITPSSRRRTAPRFERDQYSSTYWDEGFPDDRPRKFTEKWHSGIEGHDMALHRRGYGFPHRLLFYASCSCGWLSERHKLEVDAGACCILH